MEKTPNEKRKEFLEQKIFKCSLEKIKEHHALKSLDLQDQEIYEHRLTIQRIIDLDLCCSAAYSWCKMIEPHPKLVRRGRDNILQETTYKCLKTKSFDIMDDDYVDQFIRKCFVSGDNSINNQDAKKSISIVRDSAELKHNNSLANFSKNLAEPSFKASSSFWICSSDIKDHVAVMAVYFFVLRSEKTLHFDAEALKKIVTKYQYNHMNEKSEITVQYKCILDVDNLVVLNIGIENNNDKLKYYLSYLPELLKYRNAKKLTTIFISPLTMKDLEVSIKELPKYREERKQNDLNLPELKSCFEKCFTTVAKK